MISTFAAFADECTGFYAAGSLRGCSWMEFFLKKGFCWKSDKCRLSLGCPGKLSPFGDKSAWPEKNQ